MSSLTEKLNQDLRAALKAGGSVRVSVLRMVIAGVKNKEIALRTEGRELGDEDVLAVLTKEAKQRRESIVEYAKAGREDLAEAEQSELGILNEYAPEPEQLSPEEIQDLVTAAVEQSEASSVKEMGQVMRILAPRIKGRADGKVVSQLVREALSDDA